MLFVENQAKRKHKCKIRKIYGFYPSDKYEIKF